MLEYKKVGWELKIVDDTAVTADYNNLAKQQTLVIFYFLLNIQKKQNTIQNAQVIFTSNFIKLCFGII